MHGQNYKEICRLRVSLGDPRCQLQSFPVEMFTQQHEVALLVQGEVPMETTVALELHH